MARLAVGEVSLNVELAGSGTPLLLLHGFTGSAAGWARQSECLRRSFLTIAIDLLGHGCSDVPANPARYRMERCIEDLARLLDRLRIDSAHWLGYSMGGRVALAFAAAHPGRVQRLVLEGASPGLADAAARRARAAADDELARRLERDGLEAFVNAWTQQPLFASQARLGPAALAAARAARLGNDPIGLANCLRGLGTGVQPPLWHHLAEISAPTLLVAGAEDDKFRAIAQAMAAHMPRARVAVIPEAGHTTHLENPAAFNRHVIAFLQPGNSPEAADERG
ncbi:MAG: 2-succinyl-6-hydroxy-2,4-cyclohexadiene-1-carboxylate synthase [Deltaproteobacteria bacterium]|nr:2-succinyl-6-hydroxy-2,4-cyclohexadiene-1-carboxylate synthase [Deltaproteobacteria bacterium]